ncbi:MAG: ThiF family adenylyltransferase [Thermoplasmatales archaeon]|nr:ThiF family adenylyltransferase [Thermoplasmatales archaeon]
MEIKVGNIDEDKYSRLKLYEWFDIEKVRIVKVLVVGAGALGNEVCKNLVLSGYKNIDIVDADKIVISNLSRCIFFNEKDRGKFKAEILAKRLNRIEKDAKIRYFNKKIEEMQEKFIPSHDLVIGCVDNIEARLHINSFCYLYEIPYIDGAIDGQIGKVQVVFPPHTSCFECYINSTHEEILKKRFSCTGNGIKYFEPKIASDINTASIIASFQVQEALKITHSMENYIRNIFYYDGSRNFFDIFELPISKKCNCHKKFIY